jgi:hypothetical protein
MNKMRLMCLLVVFITSCRSGFENQPGTTEWVQGTEEQISVSSTPHVETAVLSSNKQCYKTFQEFAYTLSDSDFPDKLLPTDPWQIENSLPNQQAEGFFVDDIQVELARSVDGYQEIWLAKPADYTEDKSKNAFAIYRPESQEWQEVSGKVGNTDIFVQDLFLTRDGTVWGKNTWSVPYNEEAIPNKGAVLSKFNQQTQRFEFVTGVPEIPFTYEQSFLMPEIVLDEQDIFWIFVQYDGLYRFDPAIQLTTKEEDLPDFNVNTSTLSSDGSIYLVNYDFRELASGKPSFRIYEGMLSQFIPSSGELVHLRIPDEPWPSFSGMLMTQTGQLWLGAIGYRESNGTWHLIHPDPESYFEHVGDPSWPPPLLMLESSDGLLWFQKYLGASLRNEGTAWYDPNTGEGCMFTNFPANIIEDSQHQLWMFADGKLYKYSLEQ